MRFVDVNIDGLPYEVTSLNDSGCQLCVIKAEVVKSLNLPKLGEAKLRGLSAEVVPAEIVRVKMKMAPGRGFLNVTCAVVENLNYSLILGSDIVEKLNIKMIDEQFDINNVIDINDADADNDNVCDVGADEAHDDENDECDENQHNDADVNDDKTEHDPRKASAEVLKAEQRSDKSLAGCWSLAERQKAGYFVHDGILYRHQKILAKIMSSLFCLLVEGLK